MHTHNAEVSVHRSYPLVRLGLQQLAADELLERQNHAVFALDTDRCATVLYRLDRIFDLYT